MAEERPPGITPEEWDSARRVADTVNIHVHAVVAGGDRERPAYVAVNIADGRSPDGGVLYDTREEASKRFQFDTSVFFLKIGRELITNETALIQLQLYRKALRTGHVIGRTDVVVPQLLELLTPVLPRTMKGVNGHGNR
jgi:hypothetical protein